MAGSPAENPHRIGRFVTLRRLGQGGMGVVYAAYDEELNRKVAVKLLHSSQQASMERRAYILREAQAMARVSHPNVVSIYEVGEADGEVFIAMEFVDGTSLSAWQSQAQRNWEELLRVYLAAGEGLLAAHRAGLVHRDFKPDNVLIGSDGRPRVADFGLARGTRTRTPLPGDQQPAANRSHDALLSQGGALMGTPAYMSPEQFAGEAADSRSDQFSFCAALYEALYKQLPFHGTDLADLSVKVRSGQLRPAPSGSRVPALLEQTLRRGMALEPAQRFPSMAELLAALDIDPRQDPAAASGLARTFSVAVLAPGILASVTIALSLGREAPRLRHLFFAAVLLFLGALCTAWLLRRQLQRNQFQRGLVKMIIILMAQLVGMRGVGLLFGLGLAEEGALELMATAGLLAVGSVHYLPILWIMTGVCVVWALLLPIYPSTLMPMIGALYPALGIVFLISVNRAARQVAPRGDVSRLRQRNVRRGRS